MKTETMPERVTVMRTVTYDVKEVIETLAGIGITGATWTDVEQLISTFASEDFTVPVAPKDLVWLDQDGEEL